MFVMLIYNRKYILQIIHINLLRKHSIIKKILFELTSSISFAVACLLSDATNSLSSATAPKTQIVHDQHYSGQNKHFKISTYAYIQL